MADEPNETRAWYKVVSDFGPLKKGLQQYRTELAKTKAAEEAFNNASTKRKVSAAESALKSAKAAKTELQALRELNAEQKKANGVVKDTAAATKDAQNATEGAAKTATNAASKKKQQTTVESKLTDALKAQAKAQKDVVAAEKKAAASRRASMRQAVAALRAQERQARFVNEGLARTLGRADSGYKPTAFGKIDRSAEQAQKKAIATEEALAKAQERAAATARKKAAAVREEALALDRARQSSVRFVEDVGQVNQATGEVVESVDKVTTSTNRWRDALNNAQALLGRSSTNTAAYTRAQELLERAHSRRADEADRVTIAEAKLAQATVKYGQDSAQAVAAAARLSRARRSLAMATDVVTKAEQRLKNEGGGLPPIQRRIENGANGMYRAFQKFGNWRPRLIPPFVALIPIIGAVVAAVNPLVAILGTLGPLTLGVASSIGSLSGAFLALPGILSAVVGGIASVIASFGGVGNVFKTYGAMQKATTKAGRGGGGGGQSQADRAYDLARAEYNLAKAQKNVQKAQQNLNKAREEALADLIDLRQEVSRAGMDEERAIANLRLAQEAYWNTMADPGSTQGDKLSAVADLKEAEADLQDVRKTNEQNLKDLNEAEKKGIDNADKVVDAQENLEDAVWSQRDAQKALKQQQDGTAASADALASATADYEDALNKLSPSAKTFVLAILAMQDQWTAFKKTLQEDFFSQFVGSLDRMPRILRSIEALLRPSAVSMGQFVDQFLRLVDSPEWEADLKTIGEQNGAVLDEMGRGGLALADAFRELVVAAGPFTEWLVGSLADGVENLRDLIATGRETGELAGWLETVEGRLSRWWQVIKNIGSTLFNYSAAASDFGDWILDNLVDMTAGWAESAKAAREEGSPFRKWLEDIKPLLGEVNGLFGDFFGWFRDTAMDPEMIAQAQDLVKTIREDLGPALSEFLDVMARSNIDEMFVETLSSIIESISSIMENGGGAALETFFEVLENAFLLLEDVVKKVDPGVLKFVLSWIGALAAFAFIGQFSGLTTLFGWLLRLSKGAGGFKLLGSIFDKLKGLGGANFGGVGGFLGKLLKVGGVAGAIVSVIGGLADVGSTAYKGLDALNRGDTKGAREGITNVDSGLLFKENPLVPGPMGNPLSMLPSAAGSIDAIFGTDFKSQLQTIVDDSSKTIGQWILDTTADWNTFWGTTVPEGWNGIVDDWNTFWGTTLPEAWNGFWTTVGTEWDNFWTDMGDPETWNTAGENLGQFLLDVGTNWDTFWGTTLPEAWTNFGSNISTWWTEFSTGFQEGWDSFWGTVATNWNTFWGTTVPEAWNNFWTQFNTDVATNTTNFQSGWDTFWGGVGTNWNNFWSALTTGQLWTNIGTELTNFGNTFSTNWNNFWSGIPGAVQSAVNSIGGLWSGIQNILATPVNWVIENVWNRGIVQFWNGLASKLGWSKLDTFGGIGAPSAPQTSRPTNRGMFAQGGVLPGYTPGRDVHEFYSPTGGRLSLSGGEAIMRPEFVRMVGGEKGVEALNRKSRKGEAFASGGVWNGRGNLRGGTPTPDVPDQQNNFWNDIFSAPVKFVSDGLNNAVAPFMSGIGSSDYAEMIKKLPGKAIEGVANWAKGLAATDSPDGSGMPANAMGWLRQWNIVKAQFPWATLNSAYRPGARTVNGGLSYHGSGRAIDTTPSMEIFNWLRANFPNSRELIYSPAGGRQLQNGSNYMWGGAVRDMHWNHVHWAMKNGGVLPGLFDDGGLLQHGQIGVNRSGKPEAVLDPEQTKMFRNLFQGSGITAMPAMSAMPGLGVSTNNANRIIDNSVNIDKFITNNPVPERASESLPKAIRLTGYANNARGS